MQLQTYDFKFLQTAVCKKCNTMKRLEFNEICIKCQLLDVLYNSKLLDPPPMCGVRNAL